MRCLNTLIVTKAFQMNRATAKSFVNGSHKQREVTTGIGKIPIKQPRVNDRREGQRFTSAILPKYARRSPSIDTLIPTLYLKGVSTSSFSEALEAIPGKGAPGLSPTNVTRLKQIWEDEYKSWKQRDLTGKHYVYVWADGIYFNVRLDKDRPCVLVLVGATAEGSQGSHRYRGRSAREQALLANPVAGPQSTRFDDRPIPGRRRRFSGLLGGIGRGVPPDKAPAMLGP